MIEAKNVSCGSSYCFKVFPFFMDDQMTDDKM